MKDGSGNLLGSWKLSRIEQYAGGFVTDISISTDGTRKTIGTDVFAGYVRDTDDPEWRCVFTEQTMQPADYAYIPPATSKTGQGNLVGCKSIQIAPSDKNRIYAVGHGYLFRIDIGAAPAKTITATRCNLSQRRIDPNMGNDRFWSSGIAIHPTNKDICILGTDNDGVWYTTDGGVSPMVQVAGLPDCQSNNNRYMVAIDPSDGNYVYVHVYGTGLYRSTTGVTGTFTQVTGGPLSCTCMRFLNDGTLYIGSDAVRDGSRNNIWKLRDEAWAQLTIPQIDIATFDFNPAVPGHLVGMNTDGAMAVSLDYGLTWLGSNSSYNTAYPPNAPISRGGGEVLWAQHRKDSHFTAQIRFDTATSDRLWITNGIGTAYCDTVPTVWNTAPGPTWIDWSKGIHELVGTNHFVNPNTGTMFCIDGDKPIWRDARRAGGLTPLWPFWNDTLDGTNKPHSKDTPQGHMIDYAIDDPNWLVACVGRVGGYHCFSADDGKRWDEWTGPFPGGQMYEGGSIAVSNKDNVIIAQARSTQGRVIYSLNATQKDAVWNDINLGGVTPITSTSIAVWLHRRILTSDKTRPGVFAILINNVNPATSQTPRTDGTCGLWVTTNGGVNWTKTYDGVIGFGPNPGAIAGKDTRQFYQAKLSYIPGRTGELLYNPHATDSDAPEDEFYHITNDGANVTSIRPSEIKMMRWFDFGKNINPSSPYPAVYFYAKVSGVWGVYVTWDFFATAPVLICSQYPGGWLDRITNIGADLYRPGVCYIGHGGSGHSRLDYGYRLGTT